MPRLPDRSEQFHGAVVRWLTNGSRLDLVDPAVATAELEDPEPCGVRPTDGSMDVAETRVAIIGATGPFGRGIAARLAAVGLSVELGSRDLERASAAADRVTARLDDAGRASDTRGSVGYGTNAEVLERAPIAMLAVPYGGLDPTLDAIVDTVGNRIVVSVVNPLRFDDRGPEPLPVEDGSAAERVAARLPDARVVAGLHSVSSRQLWRLQDPLDDDVPIVGDDEEALETVAAIIDRLEGARAVIAGPLRLARPLEEFTSVLLSVNRRHRTHAGLRLSRV